MVALPNEKGIDRASSGRSKTPLASAFASFVTAKFTSADVRSINRRTLERYVAPLGVRRRHRSPGRRLPGRTRGLPRRRSRRLRRSARCRVWPPRRSSCRRSEIDEFKARPRQAASVTTAIAGLGDAGSPASGAGGRSVDLVKTWRDDLGGGTGPRRVPDRAVPGSKSMGLDQVLIALRDLAGRGEERLDACVVHFSSLSNARTRMPAICRYRSTTIHDQCDGAGRDGDPSCFATPVVRGDVVADRCAWRYGRRALTGRPGGDGRQAAEQWSRLFGIQRQLDVDSDVVSAGSSNAQVACAPASTSSLSMKCAGTA